MFPNYAAYPKVDTVVVIFSCHWSVRGIVVTSLFTLVFNTDSAGMLYVL